MDDATDRDPAATAGDRPPPRRRIVAAAAAIFAKHGFAGARVDEIARRAGVNKAMLYYYVGDKRALFREVLVGNFDRLLDAVRSVEAEGTPRQRLRTFIDTFADTLASMPEQPHIMLREIAAGGSNLSPQVVHRIAAIIGIVRSILSDGVRCGELRPLDPLLTHLTLVGSLVFITSVQPFAERVATAAGIEDQPRFPGDRRQVSDFLYTLLIDGLAVRSATGETS